jgi:hypothetical protein
MATTILSVDDDGLVIKLSNGTNWQPSNIGDMTKTILWYPTQRIKITKNQDKETILTNLDTASPDEITVSPL